MFPLALSIIKWLQCFMEIDLILKSSSSIAKKTYSFINIPKSLEYLMRFQLFQWCSFISLSFLITEIRINPSKYQKYTLFLYSCLKNANITWLVLIWMSNKDLCVFHQWRCRVKVQSNLISWWALLYIEQSSCLQKIFLCEWWIT